jgi:hypothetical protein
VQQYLNFFLREESIERGAFLCVTLPLFEEVSAKLDYRYSRIAAKRSSRKFLDFKGIKTSGESPSIVSRPRILAPSPVVLAL